MFFSQIPPRLLIAACCAFFLQACQPKQQEAEKPPAYVRVEKVAFVDYTPTVSLTGQIEARIETDLSFRVSGRIIERLADIGSHVKAGDVLARLDPEEQNADVAAADASVRAAQAQVTQLTATFHRQRDLLAKGFTTRSDYDKAEAAYRTAQSAVEQAEAAQGTAREALAYTVLKADADGIITTLNMEVGQVAQAAQMVFKLAHDGPRDAVFQFFEAAFARQDVSERKPMSISLVNRPELKTMGTIREISPTVDAATGTVRLKAGLASVPPDMSLGAAVTGTQQLSPVKVAMLPWRAMASDGSQPAIWIMDPQSRAVSLRKVTIFAYEKETVLVSGGLEPGMTAVTDGGKLLRPGQIVTVLDEAAR